ncbi:diguanylate cyclase [Neobacillus terrae]|uniref:bifunctional diguanylate cyclase/phosphohydrolase n=1 Tax=Neobacillus terrae TaxID=3034837 RepID=UPI00140D6641|nr:diguanylate cyclase [Neobacillus terrae]NHM33854.1 diguanylate cyclase [Neobacillus terrae]
MEGNLLLNSYQALCLSIFLFLSFLLYQPINESTWILVITFAGAATLFDERPIVLPSSDNLSLVTPLLFTAGVLYGVFPIFLINICMVAFLIMINPKKWVSHAFNGIQYSLSGYIGFFFFNLIYNPKMDSLIANLPAFISYAISFFISNVLFLSIYLCLRSKKSIVNFLKIFLERKAVLIYFTMMALGLIMAVVVREEGILGIILFCLIMWTLGVSYRSYYQMFDHFRSLSEKDELTKLFNHRYFQENLDTTIKNEEKGALLLIDLDHFKVFNDTFGHPEGDKLLRELAGILTDSIPSSGIACRYGGEEFAIILPGEDTNSAIQIAEEIRRSVSEHPFKGREHMPQKKVTVSIGISTFPDMGHSREQLIMLADQALYKTKYSSRNRVQLYTSVIDELKGNYQFDSAEEEEVIQTLKTFLMIINSKDRYTYGHTERIMEYSERLARKIGLSKTEVKNIRYGALLHDIGKVEVPTEVLNKTSKLTNSEWETIKMHVIWGEQMVQSIKELKDCLPMIRHHHERYDGKGYPDQLSSESIPLAARILTIADCFDAMTTNRPYQKAISPAEAIDEIIRCSGTQFDPQIVQPFIEVISELKPELQLLYKKEA